MAGNAARRFRDRSHAGTLLAEALDRFRDDDVVVLGLPRGGVLVAEPIARRLAAPLDLLLVRTLEVPDRDVGFGAIAAGGVRVLLESVVERLELSDETIARVGAREREELQRQEAHLLGERAPEDLQGRVVIVVDDCLVTGARMIAGVQAVRALGAARIITAVPVGAAPTCELIRRHTDGLVCLEAPAHLGEVARWYEDFHAPTDDEIRQILASDPGRVAGEGPLVGA